MTDIVKQLRDALPVPEDWDGFDPLMNDAANEIERLRVLLHKIATSINPQSGRALARRELNMKDEKSQVEKVLDGEIGQGSLFEWAEKGQ